MTSGLYFTKTHRAFCCWSSTFLLASPLSRWLINMDNLIPGQVSKLLDRLGEAECRAKLLKAEIKDIRAQIASLREAAVCVLSGGTSSVLRNSNNLIPTSSCSSKRSIEMVDSSGDSQSKRKAGENLPLENGYVVVYTDGACENNGKPNARAGIGVWFSDGHSLNISEPVVGRATNNTAEIQAPTKALILLKELGFSKVKIMTDSQFTINCITKWIKNWKRNNWKLSSGGPVKNKEDLVKLDQMCQKFDDIKWEYCAGHQGIKGNEEADKLARQGALRYKK